LLSPPHFPAASFFDLGYENNEVKLETLMNAAREKDDRDRCRVTFLGHASTLISMNGLNILTDPHLGRHIMFFLWRKSALPMRIKNLPPLDLLLISHGHYDHLDLPTLRKLSREIPTVAAPGLETILRMAGRRRVVTLREWESHEFREIKVTAVPAEHFLGRPPFFPASKYQGYIIDGDATVYFAGDSAIFDGMSEVGWTWDIDIALLPIGAYNPPSFRRHHMSPEDAVEAGRMLRAKAVVPIHWGAFKLSLEPMGEPVPRLRRAAKKAGCADQVKILSPGESVVVCRNGSVEISGGKETDI
jgi:L-ascorbate metabolism protein UlaG (beta-lactamase superfamily)